MTRNQTDAERTACVEGFLSSIRDGSSPLDGVMSPLTHSLVERFSAKGVDMTSLWAFTPKEWICPGCGRSKPDLVRLNAKGELMCRLVDHHDHMKDLLIDEFRKISSSLDVVVADEIAEAFAKRSATMVSVHDNTILCNDYNVADPEAKKLAGTHRDFSFSAPEIRQFVRATPNKAHVVDAGVAGKIWEQNAENFKMRLKIIARIAEIAATNKHWYQEVQLADQPEHAYKTARSVAANWGANGAQEMLTGPPKTQQVADPSGWRRKPSFAPPKAPTRGEIDHVARVSCVLAWARVSDDWCCPGCYRSKVQTIRASKQFPWAFTLSSKVMACPTAKYGTATEIICSDCGLAAVALGKEVLALAGYPATNQRPSTLVSTEVLNQIVIARCHSRHRFNNLRADTIVIELLQQLDALEDISFDEEEF
jgi:rubredoxin